MGRIRAGERKAAKRNPVNYFLAAVNDIKNKKLLYILVLPLLLYMFVFAYMPMYGILIAFKDYSPYQGILGSKWCGLKYFAMFFESQYFWQIIRNTLVINLYGLAIGFPVPIIFAILLNEVRSMRYKKVIQTVTYMPHFISIMVISTMIIEFCSADSFINSIIAFFGGERISLLSEPKLFPMIYTVSGVWQQFGWDSIIYLAALTGINMELYEVARVDGASRFKQILHITIPGIAPTIVLMLILKIGNMLSVGYEKIILIANPLVRERSEVISTFVYSRGLQGGDYSYSTAVGLINSAVNFLLLTLANTISKKYSETSLW